MLLCSYFNESATTENYTYLRTLSTQDALPSSGWRTLDRGDVEMREPGTARGNPFWRVEAEAGRQIGAAAFLVRHDQQNVRPLAPDDRRRCRRRRCHGWRRDRLRRRRAQLDRKSTRLNSSH